MPQKRNDDMVQLLSPDFVRRNEITRPVFLTTPLTSTSWDGDSFSTTGKTKIDLSSEFGVPAGVKAVLLFLAIRDSGSAANDCWVIVSPNDTDSSGLAMSCMTVNDRYQRGVLISPCDANGDIYFQCAASGSGTLDVHLQIWGYWL